MTAASGLAADAKILAVVVARIGDTLLATPLLRALRAAAPRGRLVCWAHPSRVDALRNLPFVDRLEGVTKLRAPWRGWMAAAGIGRFDAAVVLGHDAPLLRAAARVADRVAAFVPRDKALLRLIDHAVAEPAAGHAVDHRLALLEPFGIAAPERRLAWQVAEDEHAWAKAWLDERLPGWRDGPLLGLQAASFPTKSYRDWPAAHFRALLARFFDAWPDGRAVLLGDAAGRAAAEAIAAGMAPRVAVLAGAADLRQSAAVMARASAYVGVDTGPTHIAGALGLPMVAMYHPLHPGRNLAPLDHPAPLAVVEHPLLATRAPADCAAADMADIPVDAVWRPLAEMLAR